MKTMSYIYRVLIVAFFLLLSGNSVHAFTDNFGRVWNVSEVVDCSDIRGNYGQDAERRCQSYKGLAQDSIAITKDYLNNNENINLGALSSALTGGTSLPVHAGGSADNIMISCGNHDLAVFKLACPKINPSFTCEDLSINGRKADSNGNIVLYAGHFQSPLKITGINQTRVKERNCQKIGPNKASFLLTQTGTTLAESSVAMFNEVKSTGGILDMEMFTVVANGGGDFTQTGIYELDFTLFNNNSVLGKPTGNCSIEIIHDPDSLCGVNSNGGWNGNGDEKLTGSEECDIAADGTRLGIWGDKAPGCSSECKTIDYCGDGEVNNGETCDPEDPSETGWGTATPGCSQTCEPLDITPTDPKISILKYSNNSADKDSNVTLGTNDNDSQLIDTGNTSSFQIRIENTGDEPLKTIQITDTRVPNCAGNISLPNGNATGFNGTNFTLTGAGDHLNNLLEPDEIFTYNCEFPNTQAGYTNTASVTAIGNVSGNPTNNPSDTSDVVIDGPSIGVEKYNGNIDDKDGDVTRTPADDSQTINSGDSSIFTIRVENTGTKDLDTIVLTDDLAPNCAGTVTLPAQQGNVPGIYKERSLNFTDALLNDAILQPGEFFSYTCERSSVTAGYINEVSVKANEVGSNPIVMVEDNDTTEVKVLPITPTCNPDGVKESFETCDPQDPQREGWGSNGCSNSCTPINGGGGGGSGSAQCRNIEIAGTQVTCTSNLKAKTFRVDCNSESDTDEYVFATYNGPLDNDVKLVNGRLEATLQCNSINKPQCFVHASDSADDSTTTGWLTGASCRSSSNGGGNPPICPSNDPRCGVCEYNTNGTLKAGSPDSCPEMQTIPWGSSYHIPTYANDEQNKLLCLKVTDKFGNNIKTSVFDLKGGLPNDPVIVNRGNKPPVIQSGLLTDQVNQTGNQAVTIHQAALIDSHVCVLMSSTVPGKERFEFDIYIPTHEERSDFVWDGGYRKISEAVTSREVEFKKPFIGRLEVADGTLIPKINTKQTYNLVLQPAISDNVVINTVYSDGVLYEFNGASVLSTTQGQQFLGDRIEVQRRDINNNHVPFRATIKAIDNSAILEAPGMISNDVKLKYTLGGQTVQYYLTANDDGDDRTEFGLNGQSQETLGLKIIGPLQGDGKADITGQASNFSDISKGPQRSAIKQKAYEITQGMQSGQIANGVRYVKNQDVTLSGTPSDYTTLVVEGGNVIISGDLSGDTFGIISLNNGIVELNSNGVYESGNIFIQPNVTKINALIYGDGGLISANNSGNPFVTNSASRTAALTSQLIINGTIFTRNTIGGAVDGSSGDNRLPGGEITNDFNRASIYDLNYTRTGTNGASEYTQYPFVIRYNLGQTVVPKGFTQ